MARPPLTERIVEAALAQAEERGWAAVRLVDVAAELELRPAELQGLFRDKDAVADAWFRRGTAALIAERPEGFADLPAKLRVEECMLAWFDALASHRRVSVEMLRGKLQPGHPHHWLPMPFHLSRIIHWLREAARLPAVYGGRQAQTEEVGLSLLFLATLAVWARDDSPGQEATRKFLRRRLDRADRVMSRLFG